MTQQTKTAVPSEDPQPNRSGDGNFDFGTDSIMLDNAEAQAIHKENAEFLKNCGEDEILKEQQRLLGSLDSSLVKFLQEKRKKKLVKIDEGKCLTLFTHKGLAHNDRTQSLLSTDTGKRCGNV